MANLPQDIIADILSRLEVKQLLCYRCVSKTWRKLIDGPDFIKLHLTNSISSSSNQLLILKHSKNLYRVSSDSLNLASVLDHPLMCYNHSVKLLGSCNGLLCISNIVDDIAFWNPCTRRHRVLPYLSLEHKKFSGASVYSSSVYGFGYDLIHDDYKLVRITQFCGVQNEIFESEVKVFSLIRNYWTRIRDMPYVLRCPETDGVYACGALHWVVRRNVKFEECNIVVALDLAAEQYKEVLLPKFDGKNFVEVGVLGGCLSVVANYAKFRSDVWVMKEYGMEDSWINLFSVSQEQLLGPLRAIRPLGYCMGGSEVLLTEYTTTNPLRYDLKKNVVKDVRISRAPCRYNVETCLQSLVSINVNRGNNRRNQVAGDYAKNVKKR